MKLTPLVEWRSVKGYEGLYEVSTSGIIRSIGRRCTRGGILKAALRKGYLAVNLSSSGVVRMWPVARIVAIAFLPSSHEQPYVNHKNGIKTDNRLENLEWCSAQENRHHALSTGLAKPRGRAKLSTTDVIEIAHLLSTGEKQTRIAAIYGVHQTSIHYIKKSIS